MNDYNKTAIKNIDSNTYWHSNGIYLQSWNIELQNMLFSGFSLSSQGQADLITDH